MYLNHPLAFTDFRLPYWDWTIGNSQDKCYPSFLFNPEVDITVGSTPFKIRNPLASFKTTDKGYKGPPLPTVKGLTEVCTHI